MALLVVLLGLACSVAHARAVLTAAESADALTSSIREAWRARRQDLLRSRIEHLTAPRTRATSVLRAIASAAEHWQASSHDTRHTPAARDAPIPDIVTVENGDVIGLRIPSANIRFWYAIPYAASTAGADAWMPPQPRANWTTPLNCTTQATAVGCYSIHHNPDTAPNQGYDCLNADVYAPIGDGAATLPVLVWFYGGAFSEGYSAGPFDIYSGVHLASTYNIVLVAVNYRLGAMGFLVTDELTGNYGLLDQRAALQWVQRNVHAFGGDKTRVTIWGESAGAMSVGLHLTSPLSAGLFNQAIMDSNVAGFNYKNESEARVYGSTFCSLLNCTMNGGSKCNSSCIRTAPASDVLQAWSTAGDNVIDFIIADWGHIIDGFLEFTPVVDNVNVVAEPQSALESGAWNAVPLLLGTNSNEGETFIYDAVDFALPGFLINLALDVVFDPSASAAITAIPRYETNVSDGRVPLSRVLTDYWFRCASTMFADAAVAASRAAFVYRFDHVFSGAAIFPKFGLPTICETAVCHASELPFAFHNDVPSLNASFTPAEAHLATAMNNYWMAFVTSGDPNTNNTNGYVFPRWDGPAGNRSNIVLNVTLGTETSVQLCAIWDQLGYFW